MAIVRYWAGAARAADRKEEVVDCVDLAQLRALLAGRPPMAAVAQVATFLVDGQKRPDDCVLSDDAVVDVLPPVAGG